jgi:hypothetical protein
MTCPEIRTVWAVRETERVKRAARTMKAESPALSLRIELPEILGIHLLEIVLELVGLE